MNHQTDAASQATHLVLTLLLTDAVAGNWHQVDQDWRPVDGGGPTIHGVPLPAQPDGWELVAALRSSVERCLARSRDLGDVDLRCAAMVGGEPIVLCAFQRRGGKVSPGLMVRGIAAWRAARGQ